MIKKISVHTKKRSREQEFLLLEHEKVLSEHGEKKKSYTFQLHFLARTRYSWSCGKQVCSEGKMLDQDKIPTNKTPAC